MKRNLPPGNEYDNVKKLSEFINRINRNSEYSFERLLEIADINLLDIYGPSIFS